MASPQEPPNIKGVLPPSFRAWYQLLRKTQDSIKKYPDSKIIVWFETHPAGLRQGYEFTIDEIKAKAFDELIESIENILSDIDRSILEGPFSRQNTLEELYRFIKHRYLQP